MKISEQKKFRISFKLTLLGKQYHCNYWILRTIEGSNILLFSLSTAGFEKNKKITFHKILCFEFQKQTGTSKIVM